MTSFLQNLESFRISAEGIDLLKGVSYSKTLAKGEHVLPLGAVCQHLYFIEEGLLRNYYLKDGREITEWLAFEGNYCFSVRSFFLQKRSSLAIECLEDSQVTFVSHDGLEELSSTNLEVGNYYRTLISRSLIFSQVRMESIQFETATQRYQNLLNNAPQILRRVPLKYIASFLGISFETLSRIRAKLGDL